MVKIPQAEQQLVGFGLNSPSQTGADTHAKQLGNVYGGFQKSISDFGKTIGNAFDILQNEQDKITLMKFENAYNRALSINLQQNKLRYQGEKAAGYISSSWGYKRDVSNLRSAFFDNDDNLKAEYKINFYEELPNRLKEKALQIMDKANTGYYSSYTNYAGQEMSKAKQVAYTNIQNQNSLDIANGNDKVQTQVAIDSIIKNDFDNVGVYDEKAAETVSKNRIDNAVKTLFFNKISENPILAANMFKTKKKEYFFNEKQMSLNDFLNNDSKNEVLAKLKPALESEYVKDLATKVFETPNYDMKSFLDIEFRKLEKSIYDTEEVENTKNVIIDKAKDLVISMQNKRLDNMRKAENNSFFLSSQFLPENPNTEEGFNVLNSQDFSKYDREQVQAINGYSEMFGEVLTKIDAEKEDEENTKLELEKIKNEFKKQANNLAGQYDVFKYTDIANKKVDKIKELETKLRMKERIKLNGISFIGNMDKYYQNPKFNIQTIINNPDYKMLDGESQYKALMKAKQIVDFNENIRPNLEAQKIDIDKVIENAQKDVLGNKEVGKFARTEITAELMKILMDDKTKLNNNTTPEKMETFINNAVGIAKRRSLNMFDKETVEKIEEDYNEALKRVAKKKSATYEEAVHSIILDKWFNGIDLVKRSRYYNALLTRDFTLAAKIIEE